MREVVPSHAFPNDQHYILYDAVLRDSSTITSTLQRVAPHDKWDVVKQAYIHWP